MKSNLDLYIVPIRNIGTLDSKQMRRNACCNPLMSGLTRTKLLKADRGIFWADIKHVEN